MVNIFLNFIGAIVALIWVLSRGDFWAIIEFVILCLAGTFLCQVAMIPGFAISALSGVAILKGNKIIKGLCAPGVVFGSIWNFGALGTWVLGCFYIFYEHAISNYPDASIIPYLILAFNTANLPSCDMARSNEDISYIAAGVLMMLTLVMLVFLCFDISLKNAATYFSISILIVGLIFGIVSVIGMTEKSESILYD